MMVLRRWTSRSRSPARLGAVGACMTGRARRHRRRWPLGTAMAIMTRYACRARVLPLLALGAVDCVGGGREGRGSVGLALVGGDKKLAIVTSLMSPYFFLSFPYILALLLAFAQVDIIVFLTPCQPEILVYCTMTKSLRVIHTTNGLTITETLQTPW